MAHQVQSAAVGSGGGSGSGSGSGAAFAVAGTDDGIRWWSVRGRTRTNQASDRATAPVEIDFSPKGGPAAASATLAAAGGTLTLRFADGNGWIRVEPAPSGSMLEV